MTMQRAGWATLLWRWDSSSVIVAMTVVAAGILVLAFARSNQSIDLAFQIALWATMATAWNIIGGFGGQLSLGHAAFFGIGGYATAILLARHQISPILAIPIGMTAAIAVAMVVGLAGMRLRGPFFAMATFVLGPALQTIATNLVGLTGGSGGISLPIRGAWHTLIFADRRFYLAIMLVLMAVTLFISFRFRYTRGGMYLIAAGHNPDVARSVGANVLAIRLVGMAVSAALTSICGAVATLYTLFLDPENAFGAAISIKVITVAIVGGTGSLIGPLVGAVLLIPVEQYVFNAFADILRGMSGIIFGLLLVTVVVLAPGGVTELCGRLWRRLRPSPAFQGTPST